MYEIIEYISKRYKSRGWIQSWNVSSDETWQMQSSILDIYQINELFYIVTCFNCHNVSWLLLLLLFVSHSTSDLVLGVSLKHLIPFKGRFHSKIDFSPAHFPTWCWWRNWWKFLIHKTIPDCHRGKPSLSSSSVWEVNTTSYNQISTLASSPCRKRPPSSILVKCQFERTIPLMGMCCPQAVGARCLWKVLILMCPHQWHVMVSCETVWIVRHS